MLTMRKLLLMFLSITAAVAVAAQSQQPASIVRLDAALDEIVPAGAKVEKVADNFGFTEGPVWIRKGGYLLFSDIPANVIDKWNPAEGKVSVFLEHSGFTGSDASGVGAVMPDGRPLIGSNGITVDRQGRIVFCAHGDRAIMRVEDGGRRTILANRYEGKRLNSPNDLVYKSDGSLYFTDPPAGLRGRDKDPKKELAFNGVYLLKSKLQLLIKDMPLPNGLAFSPDERVFYVNDTTKKIVMRYDVMPDDTVSNGRVFIDMNSETAPGVPDGMKVDRKGNVYCTGPGGIWIISPQGKHLGTIPFPEQPANLAFGDNDGKTLYVTARTGLYRIRLGIAGIRPPVGLP